jgi:hypothetical protein
MNVTFDYSNVTHHDGDIVVLEYEVVFILKKPIVIDSKIYLYVFNIKFNSISNFLIIDFLSFSSLFSISFKDTLLKDYFFF